MSLEIAQEAFNPVCSTFFTQYAKLYPECKHFKENMFQQFIKSTEKPETSMFMLNEFYDSFDECSADLLERKTSALIHPKNKFIRCMQLEKVRQRITEEQMNDIWGFLISLWLIAEHKKLAKPAVFASISNISKTLIKESADLKDKIFDADFINNILSQLDFDLDENMGPQILDYMKRFLTHPDTPIYMLVPKEHYEVLNFFIDFLENKTQQEYMLKLVKPLSGNVTDMLAKTGPLTQMPTDGKQITKLADIRFSVERMKQLKSHMKDLTPQMELLEQGFKATPLKGLTESFKKKMTEDQKSQGLQISKSTDSAHSAHSAHSTHSTHSQDQDEEEDRYDEEHIEQEK